MRGSVLDNPIDKTDYEKFWAKKRKGLYMCGFTRWIKVCRKHIKDDTENGAKIF